MKKSLIASPLRLLCLLLLAALLLPLMPAAQAVSPASLPVSDWYGAEWEILALTNAYRIENGVEPLATTVALQQAAGTRAQELVNNYRSDHTRPDGSSCYTVLDEYGVEYWAAGENIAMGQINAKEVVNAWIDSPTHRTNILRPYFTHMGAGAVPDYLCWAQDFIGSLSAFSSMEVALDSDTVRFGGSLNELSAVLILYDESGGTSYMPLPEALCSWQGSSVAGKQTVTVSCYELSASFTVTVSEKDAAPPPEESETPSESAYYSLTPLFFGEGSFSYGYQVRHGRGLLESVQNNPNTVQAGSKVLYEVIPDAGSALLSFTVFDEAGGTVPVTRESDTVYSFIMPDSRVYVCVKAEPQGSALPALPFQDVRLGDYYYDAVAWAMETGVTQGTSATAFSPDASCTRGQVVTFLWRAMGCPEPQSSYNPFADVKSTDYYYKPILWAVEKGVTNGTSATAFSPNQTCSVAHIVTFLCRALGQDYQVEGKPWYWRADAYMSMYTAGPRYVLEADCPRGNVALYLYRCRYELEAARLYGG